MKKLSKRTHFAIYILLPLCIFAMFYIGISLSLGEFNLWKMTGNDRLYIMHVAIISILFGVVGANYIKQKY